MKRMLTGLLIAGLIMVAGGAAFAAVNSGNYIVTPTNEQYETALDGATGVAVRNWRTVDTLLGLKGKAELQDFLGTRARAGRKTVVAYVEFHFANDPVNGVTTALYYWDDDEVLYNFLNDRFEYSDGYHQGGALRADASTETAEVAGLWYTFNGKKPFENTNQDPRYAVAPIGGTAFISLKDGGEAPAYDEDTGTGCSALTMGAVALFLVPAFVFCKRGKK